MGLYFRPVSHLQPELKILSEIWKIPKLSPLNASLSPSLYLKFDISPVRIQSICVYLSVSVDLVWIILFISYYIRFQQRFRLVFQWMPVSIQKKALIFSRLIVRFLYKNETFFLKKIHFHFKWLLQRVKLFRVYRCFWSIIAIIVLLLQENKHEMPTLQGSLPPELANNVVRVCIIHRFHFFFIL